MSRSISPFLFLLVTFSGVVHAASMGDNIRDYLSEQKRDLDIHEKVFNEFTAAKDGQKEIAQLAKSISESAYLADDAKKLTIDSLNKSLMLTESALLKAQSLSQAQSFLASHPSTMSLPDGTTLVSNEDIVSVIELVSEDCTARVVDGAIEITKNQMPMGTTILLAPVPFVARERLVPNGISLDLRQTGDLNDFPIDIALMNDQWTPASENLNVAGRWLSGIQFFDRMTRIYCRMRSSIQ